MSRRLQDVGDWGTELVGLGKGVCSTVHPWRLGEGVYNSFELEGGNRGVGSMCQNGGFKVLVVLRIPQSA